MSERVLGEPEGGAGDALKAGCSTQDVFSSGTAEKVLVGSGPAGAVGPAKRWRFLRWFPAEEETTRPGGTLRERDEPG